jgi:hypothetical protein
MLEKRYRFVPPGGGRNYDWTRDHTFVKVAAADTGGAYALMEDNLKREFALGLGAPADQPHPARNDQGKPGHNRGDILERAQQKCGAQSLKRLRLLIPRHRRHIPEESTPQSEGHGKSDQSEHKELEHCADRH